MCNKSAQYLFMIVYQRESFFFAVFCSIINEFQIFHVTEKRCQFIVNVIFIVVITCKLHVLRDIGGRVVHCLRQLSERWPCHILLVGWMKFTSLEANLGGGLLVYPSPSLWEESRHG